MDELAAYIGCGSDDIKNTLDGYNTLANKYLSGDRDVKDEFDKTVFPVEFDTNKDSVFYVAQVYFVVDSLDCTLTHACYNR